MTKRQAVKRAHAIAYAYLQQAIDTGFAYEDDADDSNVEKINDALDKMAQRHFELSDKA